MSAQPSAKPSEPDAQAPPGPSGRLLLRMPSELHAELARAAEREGTSLNQFITRSLAGVVGWAGAGPAGAARRPPRGRDVTTLVLAANAAAVSLAAVTALAILLVAWLG
jgi:hypothetical protein